MDSISRFIQRSEFIWFVIGFIAATVVFNNSGSIAQTTGVNPAAILTGKSETLIVTGSEGANVRSSPSVQAPSLTFLKNGSTVRIDGMTLDGQWVTVKLGGNSVGYINASVVSSQR